MDGDEIDRITHDVAPLTDIYPKRLTDEPWDDEANHRFALRYMDSARGASTFSSLFAWSSQIWPETLNASLRWNRSLSFARRDISPRRLEATSWLNSIFICAVPACECQSWRCLDSDGFRLSIAERVAKKSQPPPLEIMQDLIAGALAQRNIDRAIRLLGERERSRRVRRSTTFSCLAYLYCLNGSVEKAEDAGGRQRCCNQAGSVSSIGCGKNCRAISDFIPQRTANNFHRVICGSARRFRAQKI